MPKKSFFERLTGSVRLDDDILDEALDVPMPHKKQEIPLRSNTLKSRATHSVEKEIEIPMEKEEEGELSIDLYETATEVIVQTMIPGVRPEDIDINITRDSITVRGEREDSRTVSDDQYHYQELYWGSFSRTVSLPAEVEPEEAEAIEKHGMLVIKLPKINKDKKTNLKIKSI